MIIDVKQYTIKINGFICGCRAESSDALSGQIWKCKS